MFNKIKMIIRKLYVRYFLYKDIIVSTKNVEKTIRDVKRKLRK